MNREKEVFELIRNDPEMIELKRRVNECAEIQRNFWIESQNDLTKLNERGSLMHDCFLSSLFFYEKILQFYRQHFPENYYLTTNLEITIKDVRKSTIANYLLLLRMGNSNIGNSIIANK